MQSRNHLYNICEVARHARDILHWLPTQEHDLVRRFDGMVPENLTIRLSAQLLDGPAPSSWPHTSSVFVDQSPGEAHICPAPNHGNICGPCRACWDQRVKHIAYRLH